jgi:hypothetical protein
LPDLLYSDWPTQQSVAVDILMDHVLHDLVWRGDWLSPLLLEVSGNQTDKFILQGLGYVRIVPDVAKLDLGDWIV